MTSDFWKIHLPLYIFVGAQIVFLYQAKNPLWWQFFVTGNMIILLIINFLYYGPKDKKGEGES